MSDRATNIQKREATDAQSTERIRAGKVFIPPVDIYETTDDIFLTADMPGVSEKTIDITLENNVLTLRGKVEPDIPRGFDLQYREYEVGDFERSFTVNDTIETDKIEATYKNGVLKVKLPKAEPAKPKKITVKS